MNPQENAHGAEAEEVELLGRFYGLDEMKKSIFWFYYLHFHTTGALGGNPQEAGSKFHYKISSTWMNSLSFYQFNRRGKQLAPLAGEFFRRNIKPPGSIPAFILPLDGGRRPDHISLDNLRWVRNPRHPKPGERW